MTERLLKRTIISAYACDPARGSEPGVGWQALVAALDASEHVWLLTRRKNGARVREALDAQDAARLTIVAFESSAVALRAKKILPWGTQLYYLSWQRRAGRLARELHAEYRFDVGHHATFAVDWMPAGLANVKGLPVVWGPVGGSTSTPLAMWRFLGARGVASDVLHRLATGLGVRLWGRRTARRSALMLAQNEDVAKRFEGLTRVRVRPNVAIDVDDRGPSASTAQNPDLIGASRLLPWKGWALVLEALARTHDGVELDVYGDGPDRDRLRRLAEELGVAHRARFNLPVDRQNLLGKVIAARAFVSMSFQEAAGWAVAEALTLGTPVIGLNLAGTSVLLRGAAASALDYASPTLVEDLARALEESGSRQQEPAWGAEAFRSALSAALVETAD